MDPGASFDFTIRLVFLLWEASQSLWPHGDVETVAKQFLIKAIRELIDNLSLIDGQGEEEDEEDEEKP